MDNSIVDFAIGYYNLCNKLSKEINGYKLVCPGKKKLFSKPEKIINISDTIKDFDVLSAKFRTQIDTFKTIDRWPLAMLVKEYLYFMKVMEKCFFYINDEANNIYAEADDINKKYKLVIDNGNYKIEYEFQDSDINIPSTININNPLSFMYDDEEKQADKVQFINVSVYRDYGVRMVDKFKFIQGSPIPFEDNTDDLLFTIISNITREVIFNSFIDILDNTVCEISELEEKIKVEDIFSHETMELWR